VVVIPVVLRIRGSLAHHSDFVAVIKWVALRNSGGDDGLDQLTADYQTDITGFQFPNFAEAWATLAGVTAAALGTSLQEQAKNLPHRNLQ
jgi:hypothetical protein